METDRQTLKGTETEASTSARRITLQMSMVTITSNSLENVVVAIIVLIIGYILRMQRSCFQTVRYALRVFLGHSNGMLSIA